MKKFYFSILLGLAHFIAYAQTEFITTWKTDNPGVSADNQITIPTYAGNYGEVIINWGDGTISTLTNTYNPSHVYDVPGVYTIEITGNFPGLYFNNGGDREKLLSVDQWGSIEWVTMQSSFSGCTNLDLLANDTPNISQVTSMAFAFANCNSMLGTPAINDWDVSNVTNMDSAFAQCFLFNHDIGKWDVSNVKYLANMFQEANTFNQDIGNWNVSNVESMWGMFAGADSFNQNIGDWDISNVISTGWMFISAKSFNQDIGGWNVNNVVNMAQMFSGADNFDQNLGEWNISNVTNMQDMFDRTGLSQENYDNTLNGWTSLPSLQEGIEFNAGSSTYCNGESARFKLINEYNWAITDAGKGDCPFVTTWKTDNPGSSGDNQITIPTFTGETYNYSVDWGDGTSDSNVEGNITHTYATPGTYQVSISGDFPRLYFNDFDGTEQDSDKLLSVDQWGTGSWSSMNNAFTHCSNMDVLATDVPDLSQVTTLGAMFRFCESLVGNDSFANWDVGNVTNFSNLFGWATRFNQDISNWDVSNAKIMVDMFTNAIAFNSDISNWNLGSVGAIDRMFAGASSFNQPIGQWDVSGIKSMQALFSGASSFNQDISEWDMGNVEDLGAMFADAISFNQNISNWDVSKVTFMNAMFSGASSFNKPIEEWDVIKVTAMSSMFFEANSFNQPLNNWNTSNVTEMGSMFAKASSFNQPLSNWDVSNVESTAGMFAEAVSFNQDLSSWDMSKKSSIGGMFNGAATFDQDLGDWDISNVVNMDYLFFNAGISVENYDKTLIGWTNLPTIQNNVVLNAGSSQYCESEEARQNLIDNFGWTISDAGKVPFCNEDNDADGVLDHLDLCLNTDSDAVVDDYGCEIIPADAVQVYVLTPSCVDSADGAVNLSMNVPGHLMNIAISGDAYSNQFEDVASGQEFEIGGLSPGPYTISIMVPEILFEQTYGVIVNNLSSVTGKRTSTDSEKGTVVYEVTGSKNYEVSVNGEKKNYTFGDTGKQTIELNSLFGQNEVSISGTSDCQGIVSDSFFMGDTIQVYPTITSSEVNILTKKKTLNAKVFGMDGRLVKEIDYKQNNKNIDVSNLKSGIYFLQTLVDGRLETVKIIKR